LCDVQNVIAVVVPFFSNSSRNTSAPLAA